MKHPVDQSMRSICQRIVATGRSSEEWLDHDMEMFEAESLECTYSAEEEGGLFLFEFDGPRDYRHSATLTLDEILQIHEGDLDEIEIVPLGGVYPEDAGMHRVEVNAEVLACAINDAINFFVREVLIKDGLMDKDAYFGNSNVGRKKEAVVAKWTKNWTVSWWNDEPQRS